jgi:hypothetical protein
VADTVGPFSQGHKVGRIVRKTCPAYWPRYVAETDNVSLQRTLYHFLHRSYGVTCMTSAKKKKGSGPWHRFCFRDLESTDPVPALSPYQKEKVVCW